MFIFSTIYSQLDSDTVGRVLSLSHTKSHLLSFLSSSVAVLECCCREAVSRSIDHPDEIFFRSPPLVQNDLKKCLASPICRWRNSVYLIPSQAYPRLGFTGSSVRDELIRCRFPQSSCPRDPLILPVAFHGN